MPKRLVLVTDDELLLLIAWAEVARSVSALPEIPPDAPLVLHDWDEDEDGALLQYIRNFYPG